MSRAALSVFILTLDVAAIAGNAVVILAFVMNQKLRKPSGCYVTNLAAADLCMSLIGIPFYLTTVIQNNWPLGDYFCAVWTGLERVCSLVSNFAIVAICFDRYWLVTRSSNYLGKHSVRSARCRIAAIWVAAILFRIPFVIFGMLETWGKLSPMSVCDPHSVYDVPFQIGLYEYDTTYTLIATVMEFVIPLVLITVWGVQVYIYLEQREKQKLIKAVERSRAMSLDFTFPQQFYNEERRGSSQSKTSFWSRYFSPESATDKRCLNGLSRSRDMIAGPLLDLDEELPFCRRASHSEAIGGSWNIVDNCKNCSKINIVLDPGSGGESGACLAEDNESNSSGKERFARAANKCIAKAALYVCNKSKLNIIGRKSVSLNTLEVPPSNGMKPLHGTPGGFPTSKSTPSIVLTSPCNHSEHKKPAIVKRGAGSAPLQVSFSPEVDDNPIKPSQCSECAPVNELPPRSLDGGEGEGDGNSKEGSREKQQQQQLPSDGNGSKTDSLHVNGRERTHTHPGISNPAGRRILREGSTTTTTSDFLDVPPRTRFRPLLSTGSANTSDADLQTGADLDNGLDRSASVTALQSADADDAQAQSVGTHNSSLSSCASDLPDSASSIMTISEPPSPGLRRASTLEQEAIQRVLNSRAKRRYRSYRRRALFTILLMVVVFVVFQFPYVIVTCVYSFCGAKDCVSDVIYESANWWYWAKVLLNPFLYAYISPEFRRYSFGILTCKNVNRNKRRVT